MPDARHDFNATTPDSPLDFAALLPHLGVFGGVRRFLEIGNQLVARGHTFTVYHPDGSPPDWLPFRGRVRALADLRHANHQVLITAEPLLREAFEAAAAELKLFYCVHKNLPPREVATRAAWSFLVNSSELRQRLWRRYRVRADDAIGGINLDMFHPEREPRAASDELRVLVYGRMSRGGKGSRLAIRAVERAARALAQRSPAWAGSVAHPVRLVLFDHVGVANERDPRGEFRATVPYEFHVNLEQEALARLYRSCDLFVSAERRAGWNNTVAEAMACGVPVVCTRAGTGDLVIPGETAWLVRWRHPWFFARALVHLARDPERRAAMRRAALQHLRGFSWARVAARIEGIARTRLARNAAHDSFDSSVPGA